MAFLASTVKRGCGLKHALDDGRGSAQSKSLRMSSISPYPLPQAPDAQTSECPPTLGSEFGEKEIILEYSVKKRQQN